MQNPIYIKIHSFVDLITNSSSEVSISVTTETLNTFKDIINSLIKLSDPKTTLTCDDLFIVEEVYKKGSWAPALVKTEKGEFVKEDWNELNEDVPVDSEWGRAISDCVAGERPVETTVRVTSKNYTDFKNQDLILEVGKKLSKLIGSLEGKDYYG